ETAAERVGILADRRLEVSLAEDLRRHLRVAAHRREHEHARRPAAYRIRRRNGREDGHRVSDGIPERIPRSVVSGWPIVMPSALMLSSRIARSCAPLRF